MAELEKNNGQLKDEQESLKTVNELRLEDLNRLNSDLQQQVLCLKYFCPKKSVFYPVSCWNLSRHIIFHV